MSVIGQVCLYPAIRIGMCLLSTENEGRVKDMRGTDMKTNHTFARPLAGLALASALVFSANAYAADLAADATPEAPVEETAAGFGVWGDTYMGLAIVSDYQLSGYSQTKNQPALQGYVEQDFAFGGYLGAWASSVDFDTQDYMEIDLYGGYRGYFGKFSYDVGYLEYLYNDTGDCCGEFMVQADYALTDHISLGGTTYYDPEAEAFRGGPHATYDFGHGYSLYGELEDYSYDGRTYWLVRGKKSFDNGMAAAVEYVDTTDLDPKVLLTLSFDTSLSQWLK